jgi:hypothetical protein
MSFKTIKPGLSTRAQATLSIFLFFACAAFAGVGATVAFIDPTRPRIFGFTAMTVAISVAIATVRFWKKTLPGIFGCGALNALIILYQGHALNSPAVPVPRLLGILLLAGMIAASALTAYANDQTCRLLERMSAIGVFLCCAALFSGFDFQSLFIAAGLLCAAFPAIAHLWDRRHRRVRVSGNHL